jgi:hypothetical protein
MNIPPKKQRSVWSTPEEDEKVVEKTNLESQDEIVTCWPFLLGLIIAIIIGSIPLVTILVFWLQKSE